MRYIADAALILDRVERDVLIDIGADGVIAAATPNASGPAERLPGLTVPGMANLHSHAFQRAMAGLAESAGPEGENFWRWREVMYRFLARLSPDDVEAIAAQLYVECLLFGYTAVGEFHYLHNAPDGRAYADPAELARRIVAAADTAGIGLTLLPVLYCHAGFGGTPPSDAQARFVLSLDAYATLCRSMAQITHVGVAPHSLRAVTPEELGEAIAIADTLGADTPIHIHVAEQQREVADCLAWSGVRPVAWLLDHAPIDPRWCLIHATHSDSHELGCLARSGAVAGLCQTTEANLGDGSFPLAAYLRAGGRFGIGSDSNVSTSPVEELRWLEYVRRLEAGVRNVTATPQGASIGTGLYIRALSGGFQALGLTAGRIPEGLIPEGRIPEGRIPEGRIPEGRIPEGRIPEGRIPMAQTPAGRIRMAQIPAGRIAVGHRADLVVLDTEHPSLVGRAGEALLDAWMFSGNSTPVRDVMVAGHWVVRQGRHHRQDAVAASFARSMRRIAADL